MHIPRANKKRRLRIFKKLGELNSDLKNVEANGKLSPKNSNGKRQSKDETTGSTKKKKLLGNK
jgi:hypothetical protein